MRTLVTKRERIPEALKDERMTAMELATLLGLPSSDDAANVLRALLKAKLVTRDAPRRGPVRWSLA